MSTQADPAFQSAFDALKENPGVVLFTALQWIPERPALRRIFTSHPDIYPLGAEKTVQISPGWLGTVIADQKPFLGANLGELQAVFTDTDLIQSLGCGAVINLPVLKNGIVVGVLALLDAEGRYTGKSVEEATAAIANHASCLATALTGQHNNLHTRKDGLLP